MLYKKIFRNTEKINRKGLEKKKIKGIIDMKKLIALFTLCFILSCNSAEYPEDNIDELYFLPVFCEDGYLSFSIVTGDKCLYIPVMYKGRKIKCEELENIKANMEEI